MRPLDSVSTLVELGAGAGLVLSSLVWAAISRRRRAAKRLIRGAIRDPDPGIRRSAVMLAGDRGLSRNAALLLAVARDETDTSVLDALADTVSRNQWEPASEARLVELRLWARRYLDARAAAANATPPGRLEREIFVRDGYRCTFVHDGSRCAFSDPSGAQLDVHIPPLSTRRNGAAADVALAATTLCRRHLAVMQRQVRARERLLRERTQ